MDARSREDCKKTFKLENDGTEIFGPRIPVEYKPAEKHLSPYFPDGHLSMIIVGRSGCGKSFLLCNIIPQIGHLSQIIVCTKIYGNPVYEGIRNYANATRVNASTVRRASDEKSKGTKGRKAEAAEADDESPCIAYEEAHDWDEAEAIIEKLLPVKPEGTYGLIVFDDFTNYNSSRSDKMNRVMNQVFGMLRNYGYYNCIVTQNPTNVPTLARTNANMRFIFAINETHGERSIRADWIQNTGRAASDFDELFRLVKGTEHGFLLVNSAGSDNRVFICLPGRTQGVEEVEFENDGSSSSMASVEKILEDARLTMLVRAIENARHSPRGVLARRKIKYAENQLDAYIQYLVGSLQSNASPSARNVSYDSIRDAIYEKYGI